MSTDRETTRIVRSWLEEGVTALPDPVLDAVLDQLPATSQRRAPWWPAWRLPPMNNTVKLALAAAVLVVAFLGIRFLVTDQSVGPPTETLSPTPTPQTFPEGGPNLSPGSYVIDEPFPARITFEVPDGWFSWISNADAAGVIADNGIGDGGSGYGMTFWIVDNVYSDPCDPATQLDPRLGPSVDDLVAALGSLPGYQATDPVEVTVSGFSGAQFELTAPEYGEECATHHTWTARSSEPRSMLPGETNVLRILDVDGVRLVIVSVEYAHTTEFEQAQGIPYEADAHLADQAELRQIIDSIRIES